MLLSNAKLSSSIVVIDTGLDQFTLQVFAGHISSNSVHISSLKEEQSLGMSRFPMPLCSFTLPYILCFVFYAF